MTIDTIIRIIDVQNSAKVCKVVYAAEDQETLCVWEGSAPHIGDLFIIDKRHPGRNAQKIGEAKEGSWVADNDALRWRKPVSPNSKMTRMEVLRQRHSIRRTLRDYLDGQGFTEIEAPLLVHGAPPDMCLDSFKIEDRYLITSSEYQLRRLAVGGFLRTYSLTKNFRYGDGSGSVRNPEFSMLEWGRIGAEMRAIENDVENMVEEALDALKMPTSISYRGHKINMKAPWDKMSVQDAVERITGVVMNDFGADSCRKAAEAAGLEIRPDWSENRDFLFSLLMDGIQPKLGEDRPVFITDWPMFQTTTAAPNPSDSTLAIRSELFVCGIEIADGFADLSDANMQERVFKDALALRIREGKEAVDLDEKYLESMRLGYPCGAAMAMGFDRLVMLLTDQSEIKNVLAFAWDEV
ncbi:MAG: amino acid--tRNA ligase-related protein [Bdellovibrionales bacterium]